MREAQADARLFLPAPASDPGAAVGRLKPSLVTFVQFPGAGHVESWNIDRARYTSVLRSFLSAVAP